MPRGVLAVGDRVQLTDPKGRHHTLTLEAGRLFHTHKGALAHDHLIGSPEGVQVTPVFPTPAELGFGPQALVAQWIEHAPPKRGMQVRFLPGALASPRGRCCGEFAEACDRAPAPRELAG